ncbi:MAG: hypothetical protein WEA10_04095 [Actinomycetota bacterium]
MLRRVAVAGILSLVVLVPTGASAAPGNGAQQYSFPLDCAGTTLTFTVSPGNWAAAYIRETGQHFIPREFRTQIIGDDGTVLMDEVERKATANRAGLVTCGVVEPVEGGTLVFTVRGLLRP